MRETKAKPAKRPVEVDTGLPAGSGVISIDTLLGTDLGDRDLWAKSVSEARRKKGKDAPVAVNLERAITNIKITDTMEGSSSIVLSIEDEEWELTDSGFFDVNEDGKLDPIDVNYPEGSGLWWRCTQIAIDGDRGGGKIDMTFMERAACHMMAHHGPLKASRAKTTRAEFIKSLSDQVKAGGGITFHSKMLHVTQTIGGDGGSSSLGATGAAEGRILDVGDSLAIGTEDKLHDLNSKVSSHAVLGIPSSVGLSYLKGAGKLPPNLVIQLGTNDTDENTFRSNVRAILRLAGPKRVFWVNISRPTLGGTTAGELNAILNQEATKNAKLFIIDWKNAVDSGRAQLSSDNIHATPSGYDYRARMIADALRGDDPAQTENEKEAEKSKKAAEKSTKKKKEDKDKGFPPGVDLKIKGVKADTEQLDQIVDAMTVAERAKASEKATLAMLVAGIGESAFRPIRNQGNPPSPYTGVFQGSIKIFNQYDTDLEAHYFLYGGKGYNGGGAMKLAKTGMDPGTIATTVETSGKPGSFYGAYLPEAKAILRAWGGAPDGSDGTGTGNGGAGEYRRQFNFEVGSPEEPHEDFWTAAGRLADDVKWALFLDGQHLYYDPETSLITQRPAATIKRGDPAIVSFRANWDVRKIATEATLELICNPFEFRAGEVFQIEGFGPAASGSTAKLPGRWLIADIDRERFSLVSTFTLRQPIRPGPEPPSDTVQRREDEEDTQLADDPDASGTAVFEGGKRVAAWIKPILEYGRKHGWKGQVNSGFRTYADQVRIYNSGVRPAAKPGTSNHEGSEFPRGAVDVSDAPQLSAILLKSKYAKQLVWAGAKDPPHFSHPHGGSY